MSAFLSASSRLMLQTVLLVVSGCAALHGQDEPSTRVVSVGTLDPVRGSWVLTSDGKTVPGESFRRGLQTSGLFHDRGLLWSLGDQRSQFPGHLLLIDTTSSRIVGCPIRLEPPTKGGGPLMDAYRALPNSDLEGLTRHADRADTLFAVTEDKQQSVIEIRIESSSGDALDRAEVVLREARASRIRARIVQITALKFPESVKPFRDDTNSRLEGVTMYPGENALLLAYERLDDELPRLFRLPLPTEAGKSARPARVAIDFSRVKRRTDKARARLNVNGIVAFEQAGRKWVIGVARDQERLLVIDLDAGRVTRVVNLELRSPDGERMLWVSPEGVAVDQAGGRVWIINDPDSKRGNYRLLNNEKAAGNFADYAPQLFNVDLGRVLE